MWELFERIIHCKNPRMLVYSRDRGLLVSDREWPTLTNQSKFCVKYKPTCTVNQ